MSLLANHSQVFIMMSSQYQKVSTEKSSSVQAEMEALKSRLSQSKKSMENSNKRSESTEFMSLMIKSTGTFEKN